MKRDLSMVQQNVVGGTETRCRSTRASALEIQTVRLGSSQARIQLRPSGVLVEYGPGRHPGESPVMDGIDALGILDQ
jgi:hypothetical protein